MHVRFLGEGTYVGDVSMLSAVRPWCGQGGGWVLGGGLFGWAYEGIYRSCVLVWDLAVVA